MLILRLVASVGVFKIDFSRFVPGSSFTSLRFVLYGAGSLLSTRSELNVVTKVKAVISSNPNITHTNEINRQNK